MKKISILAALLTCFFCSGAASETLSSHRSADGAASVIGTPGNGAKTPGWAGARPTRDTGKPKKRSWQKRPPPTDELPGPIGGTPPIYSNPPHL